MMTSQPLDLRRRLLLPQAGSRTRTLLVAIAWLVPLMLALPIWQGIGELAFDFRGTLWQPALDVLHGNSPYPALRLEAIDGGNPSVYPPPVILAAVPLAVLPFPLAAALWMAFLAASVAAALWILGVRDVRCYSLAIPSAPVATGLIFGNVTLLLVLAAAVAWRFRRSTWLLAAAVGGGILVKFLLWPLVVWLLATRRYRAALASCAGAALATLLAWAAIDFAGLRTYPRLLSLVSNLYGPHSWSLVAGGAGLGLGTADAERFAFGIGAAVLVLAIVLARREDGDRRSFIAALCSAILLSPIVWPYYFVLMLVPVAILEPRFGRLWMIPAAFWLMAFVPAPKSECCRPPDVSAGIWHTLHSPPAVGQVIGHTVLLLAVLAAGVAASRRPFLAATRTGELGVSAP